MPATRVLDPSVSLCTQACCAPRPLVVVDVETTGLDARHDRVVEIALLGCDADGRPDGTAMATLVHPGRPVDASWVHGISDDDVTGAPAFGDIAGDVVEMLAGRTVVAHNALFDVRFLSAELTRAGRAVGTFGPKERFPLVPAWCTMRSARHVLDGLGTFVSLDDLCAELGVIRRDAHCAAADAAATASVAARLLARARREGRHLAPFGDPATAHLVPGVYPDLSRTPVRASR